MPRKAGSTKPAITVDRIVDAALSIAETDGFPAVTMRSVATRLSTGPSSLYAHVTGKLERHHLLLTRLWAEIEVPRPHRSRWRRQLVGVYLQQADLLARHPGLEWAYFGSAPTTPEFLGFVDGVAAIYEAGGLTPARVRELEPVLEAMTVSWGVQQAVLDHVEAISGRSHEERYEALVASMATIDSERYPRLAATDYHSYPTRAARSAAFEKRLEAVIRAFEVAPSSA